MNPGGRRGGKATAPVGSSVVQLRRVGEAIGMNSTQRLEGPAIRNTIRSRKARQSRVLGRTLAGSQATVQGLAMLNGAYRKGFGRLDVKRNIGRAKRLNLI